MALEKNIDTTLRSKKCLEIRKQKLVKVVDNGLEEKVEKTRRMKSSTKVHDKM